MKFLLAVAKALRKVAEGKASAQAEAGEWKRKYELERQRNLQFEIKGLQLYMMRLLIFYYVSVNIAEGTETFSSDFDNCNPALCLFAYCGTICFF